MTPSRKAFLLSISVPQRHFHLIHELLRFTQGFLEAKGGTAKGADLFASRREDGGYERMSLVEAPATRGRRGDANAPKLEKALRRQLQLAGATDSEVTVR